MKRTKTLSPFAGKKVGILGGGQLSRMLCSAALKLKLEPVPFCFSKDDPAAQVAKNYFVGKLSDDETLKTFFSNIDLATFENDFLPYESLKKFSKKFVPALPSLERVRDKINQKELLKSLSISTPKFEKISSVAQIQNLIESWGGRVVLKWAREGYDGKGVLIFSGDVEAANQFYEDASNRNIEIFAEEKIDFKRELSMITAYSTKGEFAHYPLVISEQKNGICKKVMGPAVALGVSEKLEALAQKYAKKIGEALQLFGVFAVEFFEDKNQNLLVNELAPRVHNTGHFSMDAAETSQFENHWRGILGSSLGSTKSSPGFAMINLLGPKGRAHKEMDELKTPDGIHFHWYGKTEPREGRKMGHINLVCDSVEGLRKRLPELDLLEREWLSKFNT